MQVLNADNKSADCFLLLAAWMDRRAWMGCIPDIALTEESLRQSDNIKSLLGDPTLDMMIKQSVE